MAKKVRPGTPNGAAQPKSVMVCFRTEPATKRRIEEAARRMGRSVTTFLLEAAMEVVERVECSRTRYGDVPSHFRALCAEAAHGGKWGYRAPGYELYRHLDEFGENLNLLYGEEWITAGLRLGDYLYERDDEAVWAWFDRYFPRCTELVPKRRRRQFLQGVYEAYNDDCAAHD